MTWSEQERDEYLVALEHYANGLLDPLRAGTRKIDRQLREDIIGHFEYCCREVRAIPPPALLDLLRQTLGPKTRRREGVRNADAFWRAAIFYAKHPVDAPPSKTAIRERVGLSNQKAAERLLDDPEFHRIVAACRRV